MEVSPPQIVSLLEMLQWLAPDWNQVVLDIERLQDPMDRRIARALLEGEHSDLTQILSRIMKYCRREGLTFTASYAERILVRTLLESKAVKLQPGYKNRFQPADFAQEMTVLSGRFTEEVKSHTFLTIEPRKVEYFRKPDLFGEQVSEKFPSASLDIEEAGNCFALNRWTASVFHLMRALEKPLRIMAKSVGVSDHIENWGRIIEQIEDKIRDLDALPRSPKKTELKQFYSEAAKEFRYFRDAWRNHVVHENLFFDEDKARQIFDHVRAFMQSLATRLSE